MTDVDMADEDSLVRRRSRRATAGNRMEAALAEMAALHPEPELEADDKDFTDAKDEDEIFDSDFQSTDEEDVQDEDVVAEKEIAAEEKQARKSARQRVTRALETRKPAPTASSSNKADVGTRTPSIPKRKERPSTHRSLDATTRESLTKRKSRRQSTILSSQILNSRLKDAEERRALLPKRPKEVTVMYTQAELLARALDTEEGNIVSHRNYLEEEEEKRRRAKVVRQKLSGPVLSWVSKLEDEVVPVEGPSMPPFAVHATTGANGPQGYSSTQNVSSNTGTGGQQHDATSVPDSYTSPFTNLQTLPQSQSHSPPSKTEKVNKSYLEHRVDEGQPKPGWSETMTAVFGSHVNWEEVKVYTGKHRPLSRPVDKCPITGSTAIYRDPRSGVPFANVEAYKTLSRLLTHQYVWNDELRCYTADEKAAQLEPEIDEAVDETTPPDDSATPS
ncbi:YL1-domain-containing protein, partial [Fomitiporia mediterranea MF3/22]|uniref:YL1-domain-containing protein n=1 Tax=Fomitiporia mediterranea (strain MF3/22) TaxID=694068 RepID=UPI0004408756